MRNDAFIKSVKYSSRSFWNWKWKIETNIKGQELLFSFWMPSQLWTHEPALNYVDMSVMFIFVVPLSRALVLYIPTVGCSSQPGHPASFSTQLKSTLIPLALNFLLAFLFLCGTILFLSHSFTVAGPSLLPPLPMLCATLSGNPSPSPAAFPCEPHWVLPNSCISVPMTSLVIAVWLTVVVLTVDQLWFVWLFQVQTHSLDDLRLQWV